MTQAVSFNSKNNGISASLKQVWLLMIFIFAWELNETPWYPIDFGFQEISFDFLQLNYLILV